ncbi:hypothetical protein H0266_10805 [Halobacillus locisalis]|uniref:Uncharacterized protein n=1 Tax=Halobacillus locisalis TaxID=220753 RepID=A0A838CU25_9BACI|nr:hypothetical protein [Halobacillus locisalis]MBA2175383.1 hypothetical protein [Halobacillus locisalis]
MAEVRHHHIAPITLGYFWNRANQYGAIAAVVTGASLYVAFTTLNLIGNIFIAMFFSAAAAFVIMGVV